MNIWYDVATCPDSVLEEFRKSGVVILCGSGISLFAPSQLPTGQIFRKHIIDEATSCAGLPVLSRKLINNIPMENAFECCPNADQLEAIVRSVFDCRQPNPVHDLLAKEFGRGQINSLITTNYDLCLDESLNNCRASYERVATEREAATTKEDRLYFKIHGSTDVMEPGGLVFQLRQETQLPPQKLRLLTELVTGRPLLVLGYSGFDFDICPVLANKPSHILWNFFHRDHAGPSASRVLENANYAAIEGDMTVLLNRLFRASIVVTPAIVPTSSALALNKFTDYEKAIWTLRLLNEIGCPADADVVAEIAFQNSHTAEQRETALSEVARSRFHTGKYRQSIRAYRSAFKTCQSAERRCELVLHQCDVYRVMGAPIRSTAAWLRARVLARHQPNPGLVGLIELKKTLLLRDCQKGFRAIGLIRLSGLFRKFAERSIKKGIAAARHAGSWHDVQQFGMWARRLDLPESVVISTEGTTPPPPAQGYEHLGYLVAQFMAFRDEVRRSSGPLAKNTIENGIKFSDLAEEMRAWPEAWKLLEVVMRVAPGERTPAREGQVQRRFSQCEYTRIGRRFVWRLIP